MLQMTGNIRTLDPSERDQRDPPFSFSRSSVGAHLMICRSFGCSKVSYRCDISTTAPVPRSIQLVTHFDAPPCRVKIVDVVFFSVPLTVLCGLEQSREEGRDVHSGLSPRIQGATTRRRRSTRTRLGSEAVLSLSRVPSIAPDGRYFPTNMPILSIY